MTFVPKPDEITFDGVNIIEACKYLKEAGADVVGFNCYMGPETIIPLTKKLRASCQVSYTVQESERESKM